MIDPDAPRPLRVLPELSPDGAVSGEIGLRDPWLARVRVRELMAWLGAGRAVPRLSMFEREETPRWYRQPVPPAEPERVFEAEPKKFSKAAPEKLVAAEPLETKAGRRGRGPMQLTSAWTLPRRTAVLRRPAFSVSGPPVEPVFARPAPAPVVPASVPPVPPPIATPLLPAELPPPPLAPKLPSPPLPPPPPPPPALQPPLPPGAPAKVQTVKVPMFTPPEPIVPAPEPLPDPWPDPSPDPWPNPLAAAAIDATSARVVVEDPAAPPLDAAGWQDRSAFTHPAAELDDFLDPPPPRPRAPGIWRPWLVLLLLCAAAGLVAGAVWVWLPRPPSPVLDAVVIGQTSPVLAPVEGRLARVLVIQGGRVTRGTDLFEIAPRPVDPKIRADFAARLELARARQIRLGLRMQELNGLIMRARAVPDLASQREAEAARQRLRDVQDQAAAASEETAMLEQALAGEAARPGVATRVKAERDGVLTRVQAAEGMDVVPGLQLAELVDCAGLSVSLDGAAAASAGLTSGRALIVQITGTTAGSAGVIATQVPDAGQRAQGAELGRSNGRLIVAIDVAAWQRAGGEACPIGRRVSVQAR